MTLIVGLRAKNGVILASDGQVTDGYVRSTTTKVKQLNSCTLWSASGELALIQRVEEHIGALPDREQPLSNLRDSLAQAVRRAVEGLILLDFRTQFMGNRAADLLALHPGEFVFAEWRQTQAGGKGRLLHIKANGTTEWIEERPYAIGTGALFAYALLNKYEGVDLDRSMAELLALKVVGEAINVGSWGLGPPIDIWRVSANGVARLDDAQIADLKYAADALREEELDIFRRHSGGGPDEAAGRARETQVSAPE